MSIAVHVLARLPVPGQVKTRLIPGYGAMRACVLHRAMVWHSVRTVVREANLTSTVWVDGPVGHPFCRQLQRQFGVTVRRQRSGDLGQRMAWIVRRACAQRRPALLIGTDLPDLTAGLLREAADQLKQGAEAVFVPTRDGGYGLIGLRHYTWRWFEGVHWGGAGVMKQTERQARRLKVSAVKLAVIQDLDTPRDAHRQLRRHAWLRRSRRSCV